MCSNLCNLLSAICKHNFSCFDFTNASTHLAFYYNRQFEIMISIPSAFLACKITCDLLEETVNFLLELRISNTVEIFQK